jgi:hypothetical protein
VSLSSGRDLRCSTRWGELAAIGLKPAADNMFCFRSVEEQPEARTIKAARMLNVDVIFLFFIIIG